MPAKVTARAVVFDCDGVLADSEPGWRTAEERLCEVHGVERRLRPSTHGLSMASTVRTLLPNASESDLREAEAALIGIASEVVPARVQALAGAREAVAVASSMAATAVASNSPSAVLTPVLRAIGVSELVDAVVAADQVPLPKPAPDVYREAAARLGVSAESAVAFEDSRTGIDAARAAGYRVVQVGVFGVPRFDDVDGYAPSLVHVALDPARYLTCG